MPGDQKDQYLSDVGEGWFDQHLDELGADHDAQDGAEQLRELLGISADSPEGADFREKADDIHHQKNRNPDCEDDLDYLREPNKNLAHTLHFPPPDCFQMPEHSGT